MVMFTGAATDNANVFVQSITYRTGITAPNGMNNKTFESALLICHSALSRYKQIDY
jgi:hypothetical protein